MLIRLVLNMKYYPIDSFLHLDAHGRRNSGRRNRSNSPTTMGPTVAELPAETRPQPRGPHSSDPSSFPKQC